MFLNKNKNKATITQPCKEEYIAQLLQIYIHNKLKWYQINNTLPKTTYEVSKKLRIDFKMLHLTYEVFHKNSFTICI